MTTAEAAKVSGYAEWTIQKFAKAGEFPACKPRGNRGGWDIDETAFRLWYKNRRKKPATCAVRLRWERGPDEPKVSARMINAFGLYTEQAVSSPPGGGWNLLPLSPASGEQESLRGVQGQGP